LGFEADERQAEVLNCGAQHLLLCCSRQWGKSTVAAVKALHMAMTRARTRTLVVAPGGRQGHLFLEAVEPFLEKAKVKSKRGKRHQESLVFPNGSDIVAVPPREKTIRGFRNVSMVIVDEAAMVEEAAYTAVGPARATAGGALWLMSTPKGQGGYFYEAWAHGGGDWARFSVPATECGRISKEFLEWNRRRMGERLFRQEFLCEFVASGGQLIDRELVEQAVIEVARPEPAEWGGPGL
jgi:hypothetical protein